MGKPLHWIVVLQPVSFAYAYRYDPWYRADTQRPVDVITDVVNDLGLKILQQYAAHGNVAFSPTGVAFVLVALYEGSTGRGYQQIAEAIGLPSRDVTRIGLRDIHRRLRNYLNADGFLGGLTLSRENTRLRPEYEDILRFYGFDLSSIEQEANVTVNTGDPSDTTKLPMSTASSTIPIETIDTANEPDTTMITLTITTLPSETTIASATTVDITQQSVTMDAIDVQSITVASSESAVLSTSSTVNSLPAVTFGKGIQPASTTVIADSQTNLTTVLVAGDQSPQATSTIAAEDAGTDKTVANIIVPNAAMENVENANSNANIQVPHSLDTITAANASAMGDEIPINISPTTIAAIIVNVTPVNMSVTDANTVTSNSLIPAISTSLTSTTNLATPSPVIETMTDNSVFLQSSRTSVDALPARNTTPEIIAPIRDLAMTAIININDDATASATITTISSIRATNTTTPTNLVGNSNDSAFAGFMDNQAIASTNGNVVSMDRKKKGSESDLKVVMNDGTVKNESTSPNLRERRARSPRGYFSSYPDEGIWMQDLEIWKSYSTVNPSESHVEDSTAEISFLVNGCDVSSVSASRYIAVLPFAYFPSLHAVALEFPLDDPRYNIILLMPTDKTDTHRLARDLSAKSLRSLRKRLQPTWVRATIPSFMLRGFVTLTSFLQRLGIVDVFEPRLADLSPMTSDLGVYARDVQQSIGINIRNYMRPDRTHSRESSNVVPPRRDYYRYLPPGNGLFERAGPVPFTALHPFLYFIVDTETSVSLIAGRVDDPLNSRIL
ncbi:probable maltase-glucoamylase 2 isoform X1 [Formica exsecta]|uniref:probable maltase-glucoamylase 2 isoform X1 n=1 Tax=Formica exsecta TaxID=72781 RepID=UPI00114259A1|nr:probable maltase-glucoamylase 2 isoform X1 [Formica exsecta]XP_029675161.1 probable maltase-glucoamylase 2 isoform X1 [Formica exsecta]XP_029675162.1 probable maltase-glucoamylase 2 isoform X1 [Formica exsecta]XP_029675163.1 probable maltase-glucoamylase 2 isoform X1 [Formica exsecta]